MITNIVTISMQAATAIDVIAAVVVVNREKKLLALPSPGTPIDLPPTRLSSPNCCSAPTAMRRLPAGDAFIQPPEISWKEKKHSNEIRSPPKKPKLIRTDDEQLKQPNQKFRQRQ